VLGWIRFIIRYRKSVIAATAVVTVLFLLQLKSLRVIIDPDLTLPQSHPYIQTNNQVEAVFGNKFTVIVAVTALHGFE
jgi:predicted RND superfamily exporter protein